MRRLIPLRRAGRVSYWDIVDGSRTTFRLPSYTGIDGALATASADRIGGESRVRRCSCPHGAVQGGGQQKVPGLSGPAGGLLLVASP